MLHYGGKQNDMIDPQKSWKYYQLLRPPIVYYLFPVTLVYCNFPIMLAFDSHCDLNGYQGGGHVIGDEDSDASHLIYRISSSSS